MIFLRWLCWCWPVTGTKQIDMSPKKRVHNHQQLKRKFKTSNIPSLYNHLWKYKHLEVFTSKQKIRRLFPLFEANPKTLPSSGSLMNHTRDLPRSHVWLWLSSLEQGAIIRRGDCRDWKNKTEADVRLFSFFLCCCFCFFFFFSLVALCFFPATKFLSTIFTWFMYLYLYLLLFFFVLLLLFLFCFFCCCPYCCLQCGVIYYSMRGKGCFYDKNSKIGMSFEVLLLTWSCYHLMKHKHGNCAFPGKL